MSLIVNPSRIGSNIEINYGWALVSINLGENCIGLQRARGVWRREVSGISLESLRGECNYTNSAERKAYKTRKKMQPVSENTWIWGRRHLWGADADTGRRGFESPRPERRPSLPDSPVLAESSFPLLPLNKFFHISWNFSHSVPCAYNALQSLSVSRADPSCKGTNQSSSSL